MSGALAGRPALRSGSLRVVRASPHSLTPAPLRVDQPAGQAGKLIVALAVLGVPAEQREDVIAAVEEAVTVIEPAVSLFERIDDLLRRDPNRRNAGDAQKAAPLVARARRIENAPRPAPPSRVGWPQPRSSASRNEATSRTRKAGARRPATRELGSDRPSIRSQKP